MPSDDIAVALIGFGVAGEVFHAPLISTTPGFRLAAVVTANPARGRRAATRYGATVLPHPDDLWRTEGIGLVVVAAPNAAHLELAGGALQAGLPVVVDKPLATTPADAQELIDCANRAGVLLSVFQNRRWDGDFLTVRRLLADGRLSGVTRFESRFERWRPVPKPGWRESGAATAGGGLLLDLGSHLVDQALLLFGPVSSVYAELDRRRPGVDVEDDVLVLLRHVSGVRSQLEMTAVAAMSAPRFRVLGATGAYVKWGLDGQEATLRAGGSPVGNSWGVEPETTWGRYGADPDAEVVRTLPGNYPAFYAGIVKSLREGAPPPVEPNDSVEVLTVLAAARRSAAGSGVVSLR